MISNTLLATARARREARARVCVVARLSARRVARPEARVALAPARALLGLRIAVFCCTNDAHGRKAQMAVDGSSNEVR